MREGAVLVVDDDAGVREGLTALLRAKAFQVRVFETAEAFLAAVRNLAPPAENRV